MVKDILWDKISKVHSMKIQSHMTQLLLKLKWQGGGGEGVNLKEAIYGFKEI